MRKTTTLKTLAAAALTILAAACAKEPTVVDGNGETTEVSFNVDMPGASVATKGISDAASVDELVFQAFLYHKEKKVIEYTPVPELTKVVPVVDKKANVTASLVKGQSYSFIFWAQKKGTGYYNVNTAEPSTIDLRTITLNYANVKTNDELLDAFYFVLDGKTVSTLSSPNIKLTRALAQINFASEQSTRQDLKVKQSSIKLKNIPTTFHPFLASTASACENYSEQDIVLPYNDVMAEPLSVGSVDYDYLATTYVFAPKSDKILVDAFATFQFESGKTTEVKAPNAPVKQNFRTNVIGGLLADAEWNVTIEPGFQPGDIEYDAISGQLKAGGTVTLTEDYAVTTSDWSGINIPSGVESILNLAGHRFANENGKADSKSALVVKGKLTINGDGTVFCEANPEYKPNVEKQPSNTAISVLEGGHLIINGGYYSVGTDFAGKSNSTIYVENVGKPGKVEIYGGVFTNVVKGTNGHGFVLNQDDELKGQNCIVVYGGTFVGFNPADNGADGEHTNYVASGYKSVETTYNGEQAWEVVDASVSVADQTEFEEALSNVAAGTSATISLPAGEFTLCDNSGAQITVAQGKTLVFTGKGIGETTYVIGDGKFVGSDGYCDYSVRESDVTFKNMTIKMYSMTANYQGFAYAKNLKFENCRIEGRMSYLGVGDAVFVGCTFVQTEADYNVTTWSGTNIVFDTCVFESKNGKFLNVYRVQNDFDITVKDCQFNSETAGKSALELKGDYTYKYNVWFKGNNTGNNLVTSTTTGSELFNSNTRREGDQSLIGQQETASTVYIEGKKVWENGAKVE